ncbi:MAG: class I SAM-dependent methyltransferase [Gemmatimonadales bacterium]|nr:class I SAM-dependent methyltransferase [Gemmatimonadales bacterium]
MTTAKLFACYAVACWLYDVLWRPSIVAREARAAADARGKPLLNVGAGTPGSSLRTFVAGPTLWGDVNLDVAAPRGTPGPDRVTWGDIHALPFGDAAFGAAIASHVLEHVADPARAMAELHRVADQVFVIVPRWWAPHTWLHPGHRWFIPPSLTHARPLRRLAA